MRATLMPPRVVTRCLAAQFFGQPHSVNACRDVERWVQINVRFALGWELARLTSP